MIQAIDCARSQCRIDRQHFFQKILTIFAATLGLLVNALSNLTIHFGFRSAVERQRARDEHVKNNSKGPDVALLLVFSVDDFWCHEIWSACYYVHDSFSLLGETKVDEHYVFVHIEENVLWFDITMHDAF